MKYLFHFKDSRSIQTLIGVRLENGFEYLNEHDIMQTQKSNQTMYYTEDGVIVYIPDINDESKLPLFFRTFEDLLKHDAKAVNEHTTKILQQFPVEGIIMFYRSYMRDLKIHGKNVLKTYFQEKKSPSLQQFKNGEDIIISHSRSSLFDAWEKVPVWNYTVDKHIWPDEEPKVSDLYVEINNPDSENYQHTYVKARYVNYTDDYRFDVTIPTNEELNELIARISAL